MLEIKDPAIIHMESVRLSFPHLFTAHAMDEGSEAKFSATFILDNEEHAGVLKLIEETIDRLALDHWKKKVPFKSCLHDGNEKPDLDGYGDGKSYITASRKNRPAVVHRDPSVPIVETDGIIYAGCYVRGAIRLWVQDNKWGKRVNAELRAVQFVKDGESFGAGPIDPEKEFSKIDDEVGDKGRSKQRSVKAAAPLDDAGMF